ncbi:DUF302 domain-containing protein [Natronococcus wangiae]|uniref:DUF302 domain-containing protein n=1 Tax=Natronococcus wangiae TaxID=3068275 RepID=UPI00273EF7A2|nr:DUF302 domain-containing protein [Natronococcus sp. AD5]
MTDKDTYQLVRELVKKGLHPVIDRLGIETAIRVATPVSVSDAEAALRESLAEEGLEILAEVDVQDIHHHYNLEYPEFKILCVGDREQLEAGMEIDPGLGAFVPLSVIVYDLDGETRVSAIRPTTLLALFTDDGLRRVIRETEAALWRALTAGVPDAELRSEEPPLAPGEEQTRARIKGALNLVLTLVDAEYSIHVSSPLPRDQVEAELRDALDRRGQKVLGEVGDTLLVGNPGQAHKALAIDPDVAVFVPLSVTITEADAETHVRTVRPSTLLAFFDDPDLREILQEMELLLWNALTEGVPDATVYSRQPPLPPSGGQRTTAANLPGRLGSVDRSK